MATVASVYAKALFEVAGERGEIESVARELHEFWDMCESSPALCAVLAGPGIDPNSRGAVLADILSAGKAGGLVGRFLKTLSERGRISAVPEILKKLEAMMDGSRGIISGSVRSAVELSSDEVSVLGSALAKRVGKKVKLSATVDPSLLGGVVAVVGGRTFDASLKTQIERFKNELI